MAIWARVKVQTDAELEGLVNGLALANLAQMRRRSFPPLYRSGIRYQSERGTENWQLASDMLENLAGDCEDLVAYRLAEMWRHGNRMARALVRSPRPGLRHVMIRDGVQIEDPSRKLGMQVDPHYFRWIAGLRRAR